MADATYEYPPKKRCEFGRAPIFEDVDSKILGQVDVDPLKGDLYVEQTILNLVLDNIPVFSMAEVNTQRVQTANTRQFHFEGGWPKEVEVTEDDQKNKWQKTHDKKLASAYLDKVEALCGQTNKSLEQNCTLDLFEHYFLEEEPSHLPQTLSMKTVALFKDPADEKRSITKLSWHPDGGQRIVGSYSTLRFQRMTEEMPMNSYVWDISQRNEPYLELRTPSPLVCCEYNGKKEDWLVGGCYNGILNYYDLRKGPTPVEKSKVKASHWDPVYDVVWIQSKTGADCASVSSDGRLLFWDVRNLSETTDEMTITNGSKDDEKILGGTCLEWMMDAGAKKFLIGTEHGTVVNATRNAKKGSNSSVDIGPWWGEEKKGGFGRHYGPIYACKRNPIVYSAFITAGDWCVKMWTDALKDAQGVPLIKTPYCPSFVTALAWAPLRCGVFFVCRQDGYMDTWDYFYRMNEVSLSTKVSDSALTSINVRSQGDTPGSLMAVGDADGVITLMQLCDALVTPTSEERKHVEKLITRETDREKNLDAIRKAQAQNKPKIEEEETEEQKEEAKKKWEKEYNEREADFLKTVKLGDHDGPPTLSPSTSHRN